MSGPLPPNPGLNPQSSIPAGVPTGHQDAVIVDIPKRVDERELRRARIPAEEYVEVDNTEIDSFLAADTTHAAPFDQEAYDRAQAEAGNPADESLVDDEAITTLTPEDRRNLADLWLVGKRSGEVKVLGHVVGIETLNAWDEMNIGKYVKPYIDTPGYMRAWTVATAAAGIRTVNGKRIYDSLAPIEDEAELFDQKVRIVARGYPYVITPVYNGIQKLDAEFAELVDTLGKQHG